jgi:hypothetical protein
VGDVEEGRVLTAVFGLLEHPESLVLNGHIVAREFGHGGGIQSVNVEGVEGGFPELVHL